MTTIFYLGLNKKKHGLVYIKTINSSKNMLEMKFMIGTRKYTKDMENMKTIM